MDGRNPSGSRNTRTPRLHTKRRHASLLIAAAAHAALAAVEKDQWWDKAQPHDIATAHAVAEGWKDHDPAALAVWFRRLESAEKG